MTISFGYRQETVNMSNNCCQPRLIELAFCSLLAGCWLIQPLFADEACNVVSQTRVLSNESANDFGVSATRQGDWFICETSNFRISSRLDTEEIRACAVRCESLRREFQMKWFVETPLAVWTPKVDVVIHRTAEEFREVLGDQRSGASGRVTIQQNQGRVTQRRVDLRADVPGWNDSSLSHELTHLIIVNHFSGRRVPRWADEGMAVLAESREKQLQRKMAAIGKPSLPLLQLLCAEVYPIEAERSAFYADSACLTEYLIDRGGRGKFLTFIQQAMSDGYDIALRANYNLNGVCELERELRSRPPSSTSRIATLATR